MIALIRVLCILGILIGMAVPFCLVGLKWGRADNNRQQDSLRRMETIVTTERGGIYIAHQTMRDIVQGAEAANTEKEKAQTWLFCSLVVLAAMSWAILVASWFVGSRTPDVPPILTRTRKKVSLKQHA